MRQCRSPSGAESRAGSEAGGGWIAQRGRGRAEGGELGTGRRYEIRICPNEDSDAPLRCAGHPSRGAAPSR